MVRSKVWILVATVAVAAFMLALAGCGGGGGGTSPISSGGAVSGTVRDFNSGVGLGGVTITVGSSSAVSNSVGNFLVTGIPAGTYNVQVTPPSFLALPPGSSTIQVQVLGGQTTPLPGDILLIDQTDIPPQPPSS